MNWLSPGALTFYFCVVVLVASALSVLPVIQNLRKVMEHAGRVTEAPMFLQAPVAKADIQRVANSAALMPAYIGRIASAVAQARTAVGEVRLGQGLQSVRVAIAAIRLLIAGLR